MPKAKSSSSLPSPSPSSLSLCCCELIVFFNSNFIQLVSCVYITSVFDETSCFLIQLLNLYCIHPETYGIPSNINEECVTENDPGLVMDTVCFIVALAQYGIFKSNYFRFVIREHRRQSEMSSRLVSVFHLMIYIYIYLRLMTLKI